MIVLVRIDLEPELANPTKKHENLIPWRVIRHDLVIKVPENVCRWLWSVGYDTGEVDGGASVHV